MLETIHRQFARAFSEARAEPFDDGNAQPELAAVGDAAGCRYVSDIREPSHLLERNHTEAFRSVVSEHDPDYREHGK